MQKFNPSPVDLDRNSAELENSALERGRVNLPNHSESDLDEIQESLINEFMEKHNSLWGEILQYLGEIKERINKILVQRLDLIFENLINKLRIEIQTQRARKRNKLRTLANRKYEILRDLNYFKQKNKIFRSATYPTSKIFHYSIIVAIILLESFANSYFFAKGSDLGILGGWLQACLISLANVGSALIVGVYIYPYKNHIKTTKVILSYFGQGSYWLISAIFNLAAAHYRDLIAKEFNPLYISIESLLKNPFDISFDGLILLMVGIGAAILASIKGYTSDDPYPGHGIEDRKFRDATEDLETFNDKEIIEIKELTKNIVSEFQEIRDRLKKESILLNIDKDKGNEAISIYKNNVDIINSTQKSKLKKYREANLAVRTDPPPEYFTEYPNLIINSIDVDSNWKEEVARIDNIMENLKILENRAKEFDDRVFEILDKTIQGIEESNQEIIQQVEIEVLNKKDK